MNNNCVKYYAARKSGYAVISRTRSEQTDGQTTDRQTERVIAITPPHKKNLFAEGKTTVDSYHILNMLNTYISILLRERVRRFSVEVKRTELICVI